MPRPDNTEPAAPTQLRQQPPGRRCSTCAHARPIGFVVECKQDGRRYERRDEACERYEDFEAKRWL